jgi:hypothetical protein
VPTPLSGIEIGIKNRETGEEAAQAASPDGGDEHNFDDATMNDLSRNNLPSEQVMDVARAAVSALEIS